MKRILIGTMAAVFAGATLIAAQEPADQKDGRPSVSQQDKDKSVTYTGCLEAGATPGTFVLSNATEVKDVAMTTTTTTTPGRGGSVRPPSAPAAPVPPQTPPSNPPTGTPPSSVPPSGTNPPSPTLNPTTTAADAKGQSLMLQGTPVGFDLATNLNHKIQITGSIAEISAAARTEPMPERGNPTMKSFTVKSAKSLADRCTGQ
jgi:hypothetical protein